jgi:diaminopimelate decarboxylase
MHNVSSKISARLALFPDSTQVQDDALSIAGQDLASLADRYGTPVYVYDRLTLETSVKTYREALAASYPAASQITYAGKAFLCKAIAEWARDQELFVDCTGEGEIAIARSGGVPRQNILVHGVNKSTSDLQAALEYAGTLVVDNLSELQKIQSQISKSANEQISKSPNQQIAKSPNLWLRLLPGVTVTTHHSHTQTGQHDSKFGMTREEILQAVQISKSANEQISKSANEQISKSANRQISKSANEQISKSANRQITKSPNHQINGIHFHQGSNFRDPEPLIPAIDMALDLAKEIGFEGEWHFCPGGGWAVAYHEDELPNPSIESYVRGIAEAVVEGCRQRGLSLPHLHLEPGRSLIARAGVGLYRVGVVKRRGERTWLLVDGGMADNPRHALYGARYSCLTVAGPGRERTEKVSIGGPYCESGDVLIEDIEMPDVVEGEVIAIPVAGAYHLSMSSNYNGARKPAVLWLEEGQVKLIQRRETTDDLLRRDSGL